MRINRYFAEILHYFRDQISADQSAAQGEDDPTYDDRQSMPPFAQEEQYLECLAHKTTPDKKNGDAAHQRELVQWTRNLAYTTGALAFATFIVACFSGWQGWEMRQGSVDTHELAKTAKETEERQLRAYLGIVGDIVLSCYSCTLDTFRPYSHAPKYIMDNAITFNIENGGQTPAYRAYMEDSFYPAEYEGKLPNDFTYPISRGTEHFAGLSPTSENGIGSLNPHEVAPSAGPIQESVVALFVKAKHHDITLFYYGNIYYTDVFQKRRVTPFCFEYLPDPPIAEQFVNCEGHNTPPKDG
jgi:hypothetical protein